MPHHPPIFVNRNTHLERVQYVGFDMDYTLAEYISPNYENLTFRYAVEELVSVGYPPEIKSAVYDPKFATRGLVLDKRFGNFLKIDPYGNIMSALHGLFYLDLNDTRKMYRSRFIDIAETERFSIFNTLFEFPAMFLISYIIQFFEHQDNWKINETHSGIEKDSIQVTYKTIHHDVIKAFDSVFTSCRVSYKGGPLKQETIQNVSQYIKNDDRVPLLLKRIKDSGRKIFLVTNSEYWYTNDVMTYLFKNALTLGPNFSNDWKSYFDIIVVNAMKPKFFYEGSSMCQIDINTGKKHIGVFKGTISPGDIFSGGNSELLSELLGAEGKEMLYVGDHIYGDILKCKKKTGWKTYLVVPELEYEMRMWNHQQENYHKILKYQNELSNIYKNMDLTTYNRPVEVDIFVEKIRSKIIEIERSYGILGSLLRCGHRQTFFAGQLLRFADLYSHSCLSLLYYPFFYLFTAPLSLMPHELPANNEYAKTFILESKISPQALTTDSKYPQNKNDVFLCLEDMSDGGSSHQACTDPRLESDEG